MMTCPLINETNLQNETLIEITMNSNQFCCNGNEYQTIDNSSTMYFIFISFIILFIEIIFILIHLQKNYHFFTSCCNYKVNDEEMISFRYSRSDSETSHTSMV